MASWFVGRDAAFFLATPLLKATKNCSREAAAVFFPSSPKKPRVELAFLNWQHWLDQSANLCSG